MTDDNAPTISSALDTHLAQTHGHSPNYENGKATLDRNGLKREPRDNAKISYMSKNPSE